MDCQKLTPPDFAEHVREFRQFGYDPCNSHFEVRQPGPSCLDVWWTVSQAIQRGEVPADGP